MKVRASVRRMCEKCKIVRRRGVVFVVCSDPRHKQRQGWFGWCGRWLPGGVTSPAPVAAGSRQSSGFGQSLRRASIP